MLRFTAVRYNFELFNKTRIGREIALRTKAYMQDVHAGRRGNPVISFLTRRRRIDLIQVEVEDHIAPQLSPLFGYAMKAFTTLLITPVFTGLVTGRIAPTRLLVWTGITTQERYESVWQFAHWGWVLAGQLFMFLVFYDLSVYIRYPFFKYILAPAFRAVGLVRQQPIGAASIQELRAQARRGGVKPAPLGWKRKNTRE